VRWGHCGEDTQARFDDNLHQLNVDYVDLTLLHAPTSTVGGKVVYVFPHFSPAAFNQQNIALSCASSAMSTCSTLDEQLKLLGKIRF
jgi:diketogulonate reductase-like aldo/keto reductase